VRAEGGGVTRVWGGMGMTRSKLDLFFPLLFVGTGSPATPNTSHRSLCDMSTLANMWITAFFPLFSVERSMRRPGYPKQGRDIRLSFSLHFSIVSSLVFVSNAGQNEAYLRRLPTSIALFDPLQYKHVVVNFIGHEIIIQIHMFNSSGFLSSLQVPLTFSSHLGEIYRQVFVAFCGGSYGPKFTPTGSGRSEARRTATAAPVLPDQNN